MSHFLTSSNHYGFTKGYHTTFVFDDFAVVLPTESFQNEGLRITPFAINKREGNKYYCVRVEDDPENPGTSSVYLWEQFSWVEEEEILNELQLAMTASKKLIHMHDFELVGTLPLTKRYEEKLIALGGCRA